MYVPFLGFRYLRRRISALAAFLAVIFGVATLFTVLSIMEGYKVKLLEMARGLESHLTLLGIPPLSLVGEEGIEATLLRIPHVAATAPFIDTIGMYRSFSGFSYLQLKGIDPLKESRVGELRKYLFKPEELAAIFPRGEVRPPRKVLEERVRSVLRPDRNPLTEDQVEFLFSRNWREEVRKAHGLPIQEGKEGEVPAGLIVGINLLLDREIFLGDELKLITLSPRTGEPLHQNFIVAGAFKSGEFEVDSRTAMIRLERMRKFLDLFDPKAQDFRVEGIRIALDDYRFAPDTRFEILRALGRDSAGKKLPRLAAALDKIAASFTGEELRSLAEGLRLQLPSGDGTSPEEIVDAVQEAASLFAAPALREKIGHALEEAYSIQESLLGRGRFRDAISEASFITEMMYAVKRIWDEDFLGKEAPPALLPPGESLRRKAREAILRTAEEGLDVVVRELVPRPFAAQVLTWEEGRRILVQAVEQEKWIVGFLVFLLDLFIACVVLLMLVLIVIEKTRDMGILLALGAKPEGVVSIFLAMGLLIVALGVLFGLGAGYLFVRFIQPIHDAFTAILGFKLFDPEIYQMDRIPTTISVGQVILSIIPPIIFGFLASLIPAIWASRHDPIKAIHYE